MAKICDPTPFAGGQCVGVKYDIYFGINRSNGVTDYFNPTRRVGKIGNVFTESTGNPNTRNWYYKAAIGAVSTPEGITYNLSLNLEVGNTWFIQRVVRVGGLPDNCGDLPTNCRCESGDSTIQCSGQQGGICCVPNSLIQDLCSRIK